MTHDVMDVSLLVVKTILLRPYVFLFLAAFLFAGSVLLGWPRTWALFGATWVVAYMSEFSSTRIGIPFGRYYYTEATRGQELYLSNVPVMDTLSFTFLLFASYAMALWLTLPRHRSSRWPGLGFAFGRPARTGWPVMGLTVLLYVYIDIIIDPVALQGHRWFLGQIYGYPEPGLYFGVPLANFVGWAVVGTLSLGAFMLMERHLPPAPVLPDFLVARRLLLGCGLYSGVLLFNLAVTFWIGERLLGMVGVLIYVPILGWFLLRLRVDLPDHVREDLSN
jgi:uncharacterized membrane protein